MSHPEFEQFIRQFQQGLHEFIVEHPELETENRLDGLRRDQLDQIMAPGPLSVFIQSEYGGWGDNVTQCLSLLEATAYESIAVALMVGINGSLFLEPVFKYGHESAKRYVFDQFLNHGALGGLMITEPEFGTDALSMRTSYTKDNNGYFLKGSKHWGGLTGLADFWLMTARKSKSDGKLARDIDLFICEKSHPDQSIRVEEYYHALGLFLIPYGLNKIECKLPEESRLIHHSSGLKTMMDLLHRSRLRLSGIGIGFIKRMLDEAVDHCRNRFVGGKSLLSFDQVQHRLSQMQAWYTITSGICHYTAKVSDIKNDLTSFALQANSAKAVLTDMMQDAAQSLLQLVGAKGYRRDHIAGRAVTDSRPFQIFEGSNDVMYSQIADAVLKEMKKLKTTDLFGFVSSFELTSRISEHFKDLLQIKLPENPVQRVRVVLGKTIARLITTEFVLDLANAGFRNDLIVNAIGVVRNTLSEMISSISSLKPIEVVEDYQTRGDWKFLTPN